MTSSPEPGDTPSEPRRVAGYGEVAMIDTVRVALTAYAAGDAFGVAHEFLDDPKPVDPQVLGDLPDWPHGGVSDDTLLTLLTIDAITDDGPAASAAAFLTDLRAALPGLRGLGPTTRAALGLSVPSEQQAMVGTTNGAMMRTALLGLGFPGSSAPQRRQLVHALAFATHPDPVATTCAVLASALFSRLLDLDLDLDLDADRDTFREPRPAGTTSLVGILRAEAAELPDVPTPVGQLLDTLESATRWQPPPGGVSLSPVETLAAVVTVADGSTTCLEAYRLACELGGDTDTVSALAAALVATRDPQGCGLADVPWLDEVRWDEVPQLSEAASTLVRLRENGRVL